MALIDIGIADPLILANMIFNRRVSSLKLTSHMNRKHQNLYGTVTGVDPKSESALRLGTVH